MNEKIQCEIIRDLIPLYAEGLCSEASRELIEAHVAACGECRKLYEAFPTEPEPVITVPEEGTALRKVNRKLRQSRFTKAMAVVFAGVLAAFAALNIVWYATQYRPYHALCDGWQRNGIGKGIQYTMQDADFRYTVKAPDYLCFGSGFLSVQTNGSHPVCVDEEGYPVVEMEDYVAIMFIWLDADGTHYGVDIQRGDTGYQMYIDQNLHLVPFAEQTEAEKTEYESMITAHHDEIAALMQAAQRMWGDKIM